METSIGCRYPATLNSHIYPHIQTQTNSRSHTNTHTHAEWLRSFYFRPALFYDIFSKCSMLSPTAKRATERIKISQYFGYPSKLKPKMLLCIRTSFSTIKKNNTKTQYVFWGIRRFTNFCFIMILHFSESQSRLHHHNATLTQNGNTHLSPSHHTLFLLSFLWFILLPFSLFFSHKKHGQKSCRNYRFYFLF